MIDMSLQLGNRPAEKVAARALRDTDVIGIPHPSQPGLIKAVRLQKVVFEPLTGLVKAHAAGVGVKVYEFKGAEMVLRQRAPRAPRRGSIMPVFQEAPSPSPRQETHD